MVLIALSGLERKLPATEETLSDFDGVEETAEAWRETETATESDTLEAEADEAADLYDLGLGCSKTPSQLPTFLGQSKTSS